ncbi:ATP/GTP-binding protein, putative [Entamoeba histolytica HM-1:IMSS-B]|uniref:ATP/GTP-binding protein, putative n=6 Tax=Entamoeba histolytica TaxID=5759 RepID=C4LYE5_ENTH1|nr:ATP/GTP-binding protein, putative [Entamoeba histolytica HM-1:IMSS]EMD49785.1 ATP/GTPbinding protein, putative [Entamoeba histolytica KU27]EMH78244.1 ATP/GTP-binding protein, putative [Entamoeba histolytica HM-1:IMSS-B]EMS11745.1 ATP/GTP-binding protein [Entamoeba histolytica HM-3:IMSS]ENY64093.1 ATP/GTP-binding protein, putative [Entamoeba histolytica HM-1:IMSS-A]GAT93839.1 ATP GTP-binding protein putative [Entamoeba histolytica]|eukprot:XP_654388.1 ATP/GTP-binding protein, putative [Entamoeba histolytica HM-1:IMSS]
MTTSTNDIKTVHVNKGKELRIITGENFTFKILKGQMEWNGCELSNGTAQSIQQNTWLSFYAIEESDVEIVNSKSCYIGIKSVVEEYYSIFNNLNDNRSHFAEDEPAQIILVTGPARSGKTTFALHQLNYQVQYGYNPLFVDLSLSTNIITLPGCIGCTVVSNTFSPTTQLDYNFNQPLVYCCGTTKIEDKNPLYYHYIELLAANCLTKMNSDQSVKKSGMIIRCPFISMEVIKKVVNSFKVDLVYVMDSEQLLNEIESSQFDHCVTSSFVNKPAGIPLCIEYNSFIRRLQHRAVNNYFYGCSPESPLCPRSSVLLSSSAKVVTIKSLNNENAGFLPIGQPASQKPYVEEKDRQDMKKNDVYALLNCTTVDEVLNDTTNVIGFVTVENIGISAEDQNILSLQIEILSPHPIEELPSTVLVATGMKIEHDI